MPAPAALLLSAAWVSAPHAWTSDVSVSVDDFGQEDKPADVVFASTPITAGSYIKPICTTVITGRLAKCTARRKGTPLHWKMQ